MTETANQNTARPGPPDSLALFLSLLIPSAVAILAFFGTSGFLKPMLWLSIIMGAAALLTSVSVKTKMPAHAAFLFALIVFILATAVPAPRPLINSVQTQSGIQQETAATAIREAARLFLSDSFTPHFSLSLNRAGTLRCAALLAAGLLAAFLAFSCPPLCRRRILYAIIAIGTAVAVLGFVSQWIKPQGRFFWWVIPANHGRPVASFINRNHFGGFVALLCPAALALAAESWLQKRRLLFILSGTTFVLLACIVFSSLSRGAWISCAAGIIAAVCLLRKRILPAIPFLIAPVLLCSGFLAASPQNPLAEEFKSLSELHATSSARMRVSTWNDTLRIIRDYCAAGTGANAFRMVYPRYRTSIAREEFRHAENEYLQTAAELGIPGSIIAAAALAALVLSFRRNRRRAEPLFAVSAAGAIAVAGTHALADFTLRVPVYFLVLCILLGLAFPPHPKPAGDADSARRPFLFPSLFFLAALMSALMLFIAGKIEKYDSADFIETADSSTLCRTLPWAPTSWQTWYCLGCHALSNTAPRYREFGANCFKTALDCDPNNYRLWLKMAELRLSRGDTAGALEAYGKAKALRSWVVIPELEKTE